MVVLLRRVRKLKNVNTTKVVKIKDFGKQSLFISSQTFDRIEQRVSTDTNLSKAPDKVIWEYITTLHILDDTSITTSTRVAQT